ncbi:MAG: ABC transporter ATP-binding protein [Candidatus Thorarchaeota archaeon]|nr:MAG: ABC transporter ATP-binding protein [Candidatus Thorarchaeota archaeon]
MSRPIVEEEDERTHEYPDRTLLKRMVLYLLAYRGLFAADVAFVAMGIILAVWSPFVLRQAIDVDFPSATSSGDLYPLLLTSILYTVIQLLSWVSSYGSGYLVAVMGQKAVYRMRQELYQHLQRMSQNFYDHTSSGRILSRLTNDIDKVSEFLAGELIDTFAQLFVVVGIGIVIFTVDVQLAFISLTVVPMLAVSMLYFRAKMRTAYRSTRKTISSVTSNLAESISGAKVTKSYAREQVSSARFAELNRADYQSNVDASKATSTFFPVVRFIGSIGVVLMLAFGGMRLLQGTLTLGTLVLFIQFNDQFFRPMLTITNFYNTVQSAFAGSERIFSIMDTRPTVLDAPDARQMPEIRGHITFSDVTFSYIEGRPILVNFNLDILPGEAVAIVGNTGAGKTTIVNLLNRFYDVNSGSIEVDGINICSVTQDSLRSRIGLVLQEPYLFQGSVRENIRYGKPTATDDEVIKATEAIGAKAIFENLENGLDTQVGERGARLSEGERQLVSFARALLANPKILILDEATSSVDIYVEHMIQRGLKALLKGRTSIVIAHRLSTILNADRILVVDNGRIVESGTHTQLMNKKGTYYSLYELQIRPGAAPVLAR